MRPLVEPGGRIVEPELPSEGVSVAGPGQCGKGGVVGGRQGVDILASGGNGAVAESLADDFKVGAPSNGTDGVPSQEPLIQRLPAEIRGPALPPHRLDYPLMSATNAHWLSDTQLLVVGNPGAWLYELEPEAPSTEVCAVQRRRFDQSNPRGITVRNGREVFVAADVMDVVRLDTSDLSTRVVLHLPLLGTVSALAAIADGSLYLSAYRMASRQELQCFVVQLGI